MSDPSTPPNTALVELAEILGVDDTRDLVRSFLKEYDGLIRAMTVPDREQQHRAVHSLKSSCRHMGLATLVRKLEALEARVMLPNGKVALEDIAAIHSEFERGVPPLRRFAAGR
ncbi:MAG: Hpt domain-containing protein [Opitutaceae bacterium]|nr:Hpt domain-containing protein [Opitutaceae bacterium]